MYRLLAWLVVALHLSFIAFLVLGGPLSRWVPALMRWHLGAIAVTVLINLSGSGCPLTVWEKHFLRLAGREPYDSGFISHYLVEPIYPPGIDGMVNLVLLGAWIIPTAWAYGRFARPSPRRGLSG